MEMNGYGLRDRSRIEAVLTEGPRTRDIGGRASTQELGKAIAGAL
jgi:isocitrate/isopropylmalate dehydrogenase